MSQDSACGLCGIHPKWIQNWATSRTFIVVYGLLGTVQSMAYIHIVVSLSTLEKRFKIASQTTGILLSGNEISQILSIFLIYYGGAGHRPRWIAIGVAISAVSCFILAVPHFIYGPGQDALALTEEYYNATILSEGVKKKIDLPTCTKSEEPEACNEVTPTDSNPVPRFMVFFSQFVLGIGTTLYYGLGQTYMDDNTKKKYSSLMFGFTFAMRTVGPAVGFVLSYFCLNFYIEPSLHPTIDRDDPRWLGAWWLGWIILGVAMSLFAVLLAMFPQELKTQNKFHGFSGLPDEKQVPLNGLVNREERFSEHSKDHQIQSTDKPTLKKFPEAMKRLLTNKLLMFNITSTIFYILSASAYFNFISKYLEVQFETSSAGGSIVTGPLNMMGMVIGFLISGYFISKFKPTPRTLLLWNIFISIISLIGLIFSMFLGCNNNYIEGVNFDTMRINLTAMCNVACNCDSVKYSPVCHESTKTTFFSACHAGCHTLVNETTFSDCTCIPKFRPMINPEFNFSSNSKDVFVLENRRSSSDEVIVGPCRQDCLLDYALFSIVTTIVNILASSGRIGNVLVNYRCVEVRDKSLAQGLALVMVSLFAMIPGPIIFGAIMDSTCLIWDISCRERGNCWLYHRKNFRYYLNAGAALLCLIEIFFDTVVWYLAKDVNLYEDDEEADGMKV